MNDYFKNMSDESFITFFYGLGLLLLLVSPFIFTGYIIISDWLKSKIKYTHFLDTVLSFGMFVFGMTFLYLSIY